MLWEYLNGFQKEMNQRERIATSLVESYKDRICFLESTNKCIVCSTQPKALWLIPFGYEVKDKEEKP